MYSFRDKKAATKSNAYNGLAGFYRWLGDLAGDEDQYTRHMRKEKCKPAAGERRIVKAEDLPTRDEITKIIKYALTIRDKAAIAMSWDIGTRPKELLSLDVGDVNFDEHGAVVTLGEGCKTGPRTLRLIYSLPYVREWLESHPLRGDKNAPLFPRMDMGHYPERLEAQSLNKAIKKAAVLAGVTKDIHTYLFRHASITREACNGLGDQELKTLYGWTSDSRRLRVYSHLTSEDVNRKRLEQAGIIQSKEKKLELNAQTCPRCGAENPVTHEYCNKCASPLDETRYRELVSREAEVQALKEQLQKLQEDKTADLTRIKEEILDAMVTPEFVELLAQRRAAKRKARIFNGKIGLN
jgi:integrase/recombinase XerD